MALTYEQKKARRVERAWARADRLAAQNEYGVERYHAMCELQRHLFEALHYLRAVGEGPIPPWLQDTAEHFSLELAYSGIAREL